MGSEGRVEGQKSVGKKPARNNGKQTDDGLRKERMKNK